MSRLIDEATILVIAGNGGNGCSSFRREKFIEFGGPDGGDGGKGGNIVIEASRSFHTLSFFKYRGIHKAANGRGGMGRRMTGSNGADLMLMVPCGTIIADADDKKNILSELMEPGQRVIVARGGRGGLGNINFKNSVNRSPRKVTPGTAGEERRIFISLKVLADIGIIGQPNCGKSTLLNAITNAHGKTADYAFTTLRPNLGTIGNTEHSCVLADIPGLIDGASDGRGLGHQFLRHIERCRFLLHVIDVSSENLVANYRSIRAELRHYDNVHNSNLCVKPELILLNKTDLITADEACAKLNSFAQGAVLISLKLNTGIDKVLKAIHDVLDQNPHQSKVFEPSSGY